jgi:hypothetical protein
MEYADTVERLRTEHPGLAEEVAGFTTLEHVLKWLDRRELSFAGLDMVTQDEFSHDILIPLEPGVGYVVFGVT